MNVAQWAFGAPFPEVYEGGVRPEAASETHDKARAALQKSVIAAVDGVWRRIVKDESGAPMEYQGLPLEIDRPKGFVQEGVDQAGKPWSRTYLYDYGFIPGTLGGDGEGLDVFVGPDERAPWSYWITQVKADGAFDEYKVFVGFPTVESAREAYVAHIPDRFLAAVGAVTVEQMKALLGREPIETQFPGAPSSDTVEPMKSAAMVAKDCRLTKAADISFDNLRCMVEGAIQEAIPRGPNECCVYVADLFDAYAVFSYDGGLYKVGYSYGNGAVTLTGQPVPVVRSYAEVQGTPAAGAEGTTMKNALKKDDTAAPAATVGDGSGGADIVLLAQDRLSDIVDAMNAAGGMMTQDLKAALGSVIALLETVADDYDDVPADAGAADGTPENGIADAAKSARFIAGIGKAIQKVRAEKDLTKRAALVGRIQKALAYGAEVFGSETGFATANGGEQIPEFKDPNQLLPVEVTAPAPANPIGQFFENQAAVQPGATPDQSAQGGTPQAMEKRLDGVRGRVAELTKSQTFTASYMAQLPDSAFLQVEEGALKSAGGASNLLQGPVTGFRHFAVRKLDGSLDIPQLRKALNEIPMAGLDESVKADLTQKAQALLGQAEAAATSAVQKALRNDDGWPQDMADPGFLAKGTETVSVPTFGYDNLPEKVAKAAAATAELRAAQAK